MLKKELRQEILRRKRQLTKEELRQLSLPIIQCLLSHPKVQGAKTILMYYSLPDEVYTHDARLLEKLRRLSEKYPDQIVKKDRHTFVVPKRCVSVREPYSAERRKAASERAKAAGYAPPKPKAKKGE